MACSEVPVNGAQMEHTLLNPDGAKWSAPDIACAPGPAVWCLLLACCSQEAPGRLAGRVHLGIVEHFCSTTSARHDELSLIYGEI